MSNVTAIDGKTCANCTAQKIEDGPKPKLGMLATLFLVCDNLNSPNFDDAMNPSGTCEKWTEQVCGNCADRNTLDGLAVDYLVCDGRTSQEYDEKVSFNDTCEKWTNQ